MEELKAKAEAHELHPRFDLLWKDGMDDWVAAGEVDGLFVKKSEDEPAPKPTTEKSANDPFSDFEDEKGDSDGDDEEWEGVSRGGYFFFIYIFPILWLIGLTYGLKMAKDFVDGDIAEMLPLAFACLALLPIFIGIFAILQRFQNLGMSRAWILGLLVPILNFWLLYRLFACPPGYAVRKKLGALGWVLAVIYWLPLIGAIGVGGYIASKGPEYIQELIDQNRAQYETYLEQAKALTESPKEAKAKEEDKKKEEKGPAITPIRR